MPAESAPTATAAAASPWGEPAEPVAAPAIEPLVKLAKKVERVGGQYVVRAINGGRRGTDPRSIDDVTH